MLRRLRVFDHLMRDLRVALRSLRATPVVSAVAVLSLTLGIGANTAIFSIVNGLLLRSLPVAEPERLVTISSDSAIALGFPAGLGWSYPMWERLRQRAGAFDGALAWSAQRFNLTRAGETQPVDGLLASGDFFATLGVRPVLGRSLIRADDARGGGPDGQVAVISHGFWQRRFGGAGNVIGTSLLIEDSPFTIVGVTPPEFSGIEVGRSFDVVIPLNTEPLIRRQAAAIDQPRSLFLTVMLRLKSGQSPPAASASAPAMALRQRGGSPLQAYALRPVPNDNCVAARRGGEQSTGNDQSVG
jgi:putative ABC transport system permease protein